MNKVIYLLSTRYSIFGREDYFLDFFIIRFSEMSKQDAREVLLHELGHADQILSGQRGFLSEGYPNSLEKYIKGK